MLYWHTIKRKIDIIKLVLLTFVDYAKNNTCYFRLIRFRWVNVWIRCHEPRFPAVNKTLEKNREHSGNCIFLSLHKVSPFLNTPLLMLHVS